MTIQASDHEAEIKKLRSIARRYGAEEHELQAAVVLSKTSVSSTHAGLKSMMAQLVTLNTKIAKYVYNVLFFTVVQYRVFCQVARYLLSLAEFYVILLPELSQYSIM